MAEFVYKALDARGRFVSGALRSATPDAAIQQLIELGYVPLSTAPAGDPARGFWKSLLLQPTVAKRDVTILLQDLALLLRSGLPLDEGLRLLVENASGPAIRLIEQLRAAIGSGANFAEALQSHPATSQPDLIAVVRSAEATGNLESALESIARERLKQDEVSRRIRTAVRYPAFLLIVSAAVLLFFLLFVVPQFATVVQDFGTTPDPLVTAIITISNGMRENGDLLIAASGVLLLTGVVAWRVPRLRSRILAPLASLPLIRGVIVLQRTTVFCRNLGTLLSNGVNLTDALRLMSEGGVGGDALATISDRVRRGERLVDAVADSNMIPPLATRMLRVGEESGALASVSTRCADYYEAKLTEQVDRLTGIVGPAAIVFISVVIGTLIVSIMSTLLSINQMVL